MTREEALALLANLKVGYDKLKETTEDLRKRVYFLEKSMLKGKNSRKPAGDVQKTIQNQLADLWIEIYKGKPRGDLFKIGTRLVREYGWDRVEPVLRWKFSRTHIDFISLSKIESGFEVLEAEMRGDTDPTGPRGPAGRRSGIDVANDGFKIARRAIEEQERSGADEAREVGSGSTTALARHVRGGNGALGGS